MAFKLPGFPVHQTIATAGGVTPFKHTGTHDNPGYQGGQIEVNSMDANHYDYYHGGEDEPSWTDDLAASTENDPTNWNSGDAGWIVNPIGIVKNVKAIKKGDMPLPPGIYPNRKKIEEWADKYGGAIHEGLVNTFGGIGEKITGGVDKLKDRFG